MSSDRFSTTESQSTKGLTWGNGLRELSKYRKEIEFSLKKRLKLLLKITRRSSRSYRALLMYMNLKALVNYSKRRRCKRHLGMIQSSLKSKSSLTCCLINSYLHQVSEWLKELRVFKMLILDFRARNLPLWVPQDQPDKKTRHTVNQAVAKVCKENTHSSESPNFHQMSPI